MTNRYLTGWKHSGFAVLLGATLFAGATSANPVLLFDAKDGRVLESQEASKRWYPASLTKLMTAYVTFRALEAGELQLDSPIRVSKKAARQPPSKMGYPAGSVMNLDNAFKMLLVKSSNDIAMAIGENVAGSESGFVARMNAEAKRLGMNDTHYVNPHGLFAPDQYTTARDQALLVSALKREFPQHSGYFTIEGIDTGKKTFDNFNLMVGRYQGVDGMKTGFICPSGFNMIGSATRDGRTLVAVVLGEATMVSRADAVAKLLDEGFAGKRGVGEMLSTMPVVADHAAGPTDMREIICPKPKPGEKQAEQPSENAPSKVLSRWEMPLGHAPTYVQVGLGNAPGPIPAGRLTEDGKEYSDVPIPTWRPDLPDPTITAAAVNNEPVKELRN